MKTPVQEIFDELEAAGIIERTGELRCNSRGMLEPVYVIAAKYLHDPAAAAAALRTLDDRELASDVFGALHELQTRKNS